MRLVVAATAPFGAAVLEGLAPLHEIELLVTRPDRPRGRGRRPGPPPAKVAAERLGIPISQPERLEHAPGSAGVVVICAYGALVPASLLDERLWLNVHPSLLPRWRGAEPVANAILAGDRETGVTLMEGTAELDAGPVIAQEIVAVPESATTGDLEADLARVGARMLEEHLGPYLAGEAPTRPQSAGVTWAAKLDPLHGELDFARPAEQLARVVRAFTPDPGAYTVFRGQRIVVSRASVSGGAPAEHGTLRIDRGDVLVASGAGWLRLDQVTPAGKRAMRGADWVRGLRDLEGARLPS